MDAMINIEISLYPEKTFNFNLVFFSVSKV